MELLELPRFDGQGGGQWAQLCCIMKKKTAWMYTKVIWHLAVIIGALFFGGCSQQCNVVSTSMSPTLTPGMSVTLKQWSSSGTI
jgi:hypothetical protein